MREKVKNDNQDTDTPHGIEQTLQHIFGQICKSAVTTAEGLVCWSPTSATGNADLPGSYLGPQLFDGTSGIALFLAAYCFATKAADAHDLALRSAVRLRREVAQIANRAGTRLPGIGGTGGLRGPASASYALARLADWLKMPELIESAQEAATVLTPQQILTEERFDIADGCAGTLLALLAFVEELTARDLDKQAVLELALLCGQRLLETRFRASSGMRVWPAVDNASPGFAHGASGIGYALVRLFQHTRREEFRDAAMEAFAFERGLLSSDRQNWIDSDSKTPAGCASWGWGAPGIVLSRMISVLAVDSVALQRDLEESLNITRALPESPSDDLYLGNLGRADILYTASSILGRLHLAERAREMAKLVMSRAAASGFHFHDHNSHSVPSSEFALNPTLFLGLSGVGYTLLRLNYPGLFPSVLFLETSQ